MNITDDDLISIQTACLEFSTKMVSKYEEALAVSGAMLNTAMSIYRTVLSEDDYNKICKMIYETRSRIRTFDTPRELLN